jgi:hypothetical protein
MQEITPLSPGGCESRLASAEGKPCRENGVYHQRVYARHAERSYPLTLQKNRGDGCQFHSSMAHSGWRKTSRSCAMSVLVSPPAEAPHNHHEAHRRKGRG